jgi:DNA-binding NtrC family response regulator
VKYQESGVDAISAELLAINLIGKSRALRDVIATVRRIANYDVVVSIYGETGTGKELVARSIHYTGKRAAGPLIAVNCGALPDSLFESELFGHEKGAFTDARTEHSGLIQQAESGTLFLDEIETLPTKGQVALLRFLQDGQYRRVGGKRLLNADVRIIVASNVHLDNLLALPGQFREDLYYRINVLPIQIPPLRERREDILPLAEFFLEKFRVCFNLRCKHLSQAGMDWLSNWDWPGNVRELANCIQRGLLLSTSGEIFPEHLQPHCATIVRPMKQTMDGINHLPFNEAKTQAVEAFEWDYLQTAMRHSKGNICRAAAHIHKERSALGKLLKKHQIDPASFKST